jgi:tRNA modification GTPase
MSSSTISAIATPIGSAGIGIIRISGPDAFKIGTAVFRPKNTDKRDKPGQKSHRLQYGHIVDQANEEVLDEVLISFMRAPFTYTKEDVVEIHAHSGLYVLRSILALVMEKGAAPALPGEFTKRAFLNGRIDLTQAEAVIDIINAESKAALNIASSKIRGRLKTILSDARDRLLDIQTKIEAGIDFPEECEGTTIKAEDIQKIESRVIIPLKRLTKRFDEASYLVEGLKLVIVGEPNVGKSSLMNRILQKDKAIVTPVPGTTRDLVEEHLNIKGIPVIISDTAGIHTTDNPVEKIGIQKAEERIASAHMVLLVVEACRGITDNEKKLYERLKLKEMVITVNKKDLEDDDSKPAMPEAWKKRTIVRISALLGDGIERLLKTIEEMCLKNAIKVNNEIVPNLRQKQLLGRCVKSSEDLIQNISKGGGAETSAVDVKDAVAAIDDILGENSREDVLDRIFDNFCIGK